MFIELSMCFVIKREVGTPLERLRDSRGGQRPSSFPFGMIGFSKPAILAPWKGQRLVLCVYLGMLAIAWLCFALDRHWNFMGRYFVTAELFHAFDLN